MIYVDDARLAYGRMVMCHMAADTREELLAMADRIGVSRRWLQARGTWREHFDICLSKREMAVQAGAIEMTPRELVARMKTKSTARASGERGEASDD